jgi:hypothetical protein
MSRFKYLCKKQILIYHIIAQFPLEQRKEQEALYTLDTPDRELLDLYLRLTGVKYWNP